MMSERKRKQVFALNPRGKYWSEDSNKFGQKLMEKMGWSSGKGLGAKEDGMTEHIRVSYKNDTQGMGFKDGDDEWTEHQSNFSKLLNSLGNSKNDDEQESSESKIESLEKKSEISKARVHYKKFTRGKDLSRYSEKDLANIFGKKSLKDIAKPTIEDTKKDNEKENLETKSFGVVTHNGGNMMDYFKNKMSKFKTNSTISPQENVDDASGSDTERPSFGLGFGASSSIIEEKPVINQPDFKSNYKKGKEETDNFRKKCFGLGYDRNNGHDNKPKSNFTSFVKATDTTEEKERLQYSVILPEKDKKNKKKAIKDSEENSISKNETSTNGFGFSSSNLNKIQSSFMSFIKGSNSIGSSEINNKEEKKKNKKKYSDNDIIGNDQNSKIDSEMISGSKSKKKNVEPTFVSFIKDNDNIESVETPIKKNKLNSNESIDNNKTETVEDQVISENSVKRKKKSKKDKSKIEANIDNVPDDCNKESSSPSKKSKKRKSESELDVAFTPMKKKFKNFEDLHTLQDEAKIVETPNKKIKKKKSDENMDKCNDTDNHQNGLVNPAFDPLYSEVAVEKHHLEAIEEEPENIVESPVDNKNQSGGNIETTEDLSLPSKKGKKRKSQPDLDVVSTPMKKKIENSEDIQTLEEQKMAEIPTKKSKKKKGDKNMDKCNDTNNHQNGLVNPAFDPLYSEVPADKHHLDAVVEVPTNSDVGESTDEQNKSKKKKKKSKSFNGIDNPCFEEMSRMDDSSQIMDDSISAETPKKSKQSKKEKEIASGGIENSAFDENFKSENMVQGGDYEVKTKKRKRQEHDDILEDSQSSNKKKKKKKKAGSNENASETKDDTINGTVCEDMPVMDENIMLNVVNTPIVKKENDKKLQRRKSVRFSDVNQSSSGGLDNAGYDQFGNRIEENIDTLNKQLDDYQAEVENDLNEAKAQIMIGDVADPNGENEALQNGEVKLKFKYANFGKLPPWMTKNKPLSNPKSSYRHLIKGDIVLGFKNTNMHEIKGYNENLKQIST